MSTFPQIRPQDATPEIAAIYSDTVNGLLALQAEYAAWYEVFPTACATAPRPRPFRPSSISMRSSPSSRAAMDAMDP